MSGEGVTIRRARLDDAETLAAFGADVFEQTFGADNRREDMDAYLASAFSPGRQAEEISAPDGAILLAEHGGRTVGYAHVRLASQPGLGDGEATELVRFYVDRAWHGRGIAAALMAAALDAARALGPRTVWLGVWERNGRAIAFYKKHGFVDAGSHTFTLGTDVQTDRLMVRELPDVTGTFSASGA
jgi:diamine N-acetyltransferase